MGLWTASSYRGYQTARESEAIAAVLGLTPISRAADVGAGDGRFSIALAQYYLPEGYLFATEVDLTRLATIGEAVDAAGLSNVTLIEGGSDHTGLPPACCDGVVLRRVYHHLTEPDLIAADLFRALRPGGRLAIIDFAPRGLLSIVAPVAGVPDSRGGHGVPPDVVASEMIAEGFVLHRRIDDWFGGYCLVFEKPSLRVHQDRPVSAATLLSR